MRFYFTFHCVFLADKMAAMFVRHAGALQRTLPDLLRGQIGICHKYEKLPCGAEDYFFGYF